MLVMRHNHLLTSISHALAPPTPKTWLHARTPSLAPMVNDPHRTSVTSAAARSCVRSSQEVDALQSHALRCNGNFLHGPSGKAVTIAHG